MNKKIVSLILSVSLFNIAYAGNLPSSMTFTIADAYYHFDNKRDLKNTGVPNAAFAYNFNEHWAVEGSVAVINTEMDDNEDDVDEDDSVHGFLYMIDGIYRFNPYQHLEPYILAGIGVLGLKPNGNDPIQSGAINAGIGTQLFFGDSIALRGEIRDVYTTTGSYKNDYLINVGVSFLFNPSNTATTFKG